MNSKFRVLLSCLALSLFSAPVCAQLKPEALVVPVYFTGVKDTSSQRILQQHVLTELSQSFELRSEQEVATAREKAADKLASDNCNEVACLKVMGELLDVDYLFAIGITASGSYWDLTGVRLDPLGRTVRRSVECPDCTLSKARAGLTKLLRGLHPGKAKVEQGKAILILESQPNGIVFLEGIEQGETPIELSLPSDRPAEILVFAEGYQDYSNFFDLKPGERRTEQIRLVKRRGRVRITSSPSGAAIFLGGQPLRDASGREQSTPTEARLEYGEHKLQLTLEKHRDINEILNVKSPELGTINYTLTPNPGRLVVRVPAELKAGVVYQNDKLLGDMNGRIVQSFELQSTKSFSIHVEDSNLITSQKNVKIKPDETLKIEYTQFQKKIKEPNALEELIEKDWSNKVYEKEHSQFNFGSMPLKYKYERNKKIIYGDIHGSYFSYKIIKTKASGVYYGYSMGLGFFPNSAKEKYLVKLGMLWDINIHSGLIYSFDRKIFIRSGIYLGLGMGDEGYIYQENTVSIVKTLSYEIFHSGLEFQLYKTYSNSSYFGFEYSIHPLRKYSGNDEYIQDIEDSIGSTDINFQPSIQLVYGWEY